MREIGSARGEADALTALGDLAHSAGRPGEARTRYTQAQHVLADTGSTGQSRISERLARLDAPSPNRGRDLDLTATRPPPRRAP